MSNYRYPMLADYRPDLLEEWDWNSNTADPHCVSSGEENARRWWVCSSCHGRWQATVRDRTRSDGKATGCPYCAGTKALKDVNTLSAVRPELAREWAPQNDKSPEEVTVGSNYEARWVCPNCKKQWWATVKDRTRSDGKARGCPYCNQTMPFRNSFPEMAFVYYLARLVGEKDALKLSSIPLRAVLDSAQRNYELDVFIERNGKRIGIEYDGFPWHSDLKKDLRKNHVCYQALDLLIRIREPGLPEFPEQELNNEKLQVLSLPERNNIEPAIRDVLDFVAEIAHLDSARVDIDIEHDEQEIRDLLGRRPKEKSLAVMFPDLAKEWHPLKNISSPERVYAHSADKYWWRHWCSEEGDWHEWQARVGDRTRGGEKATGCPICDGKVVKKGFNDLQSMHPDLAQEWDKDANQPLRPDEVTPFKNIKVCWQHWDEVSGTWHKWSARIADRVRGRGCPYCMKGGAAKKVLVGVNDLGTLFPDIASEWYYEKNGTLTPQDVLPKSRKKVWWRHPNDDGPKWHEWEQKIADRTSQGQGCPYCAGNKVLPGYNDLATKRPGIAAAWSEDNAESPEEISLGSHYRAKFRCRYCGHEWSRVIKDALRYTFRCPQCKHEL